MARPLSFVRGSGKNGGQRNDGCDPPWRFRAGFSEGSLGIRNKDQGNLAVLSSVVGKFLRAALRGGPHRCFRSSAVEAEADIPGTRPLF
jgi:hypothetical protein